MFRTAPADSKGRAAAQLVKDALRPLHCLEWHARRWLALDPWKLPAARHPSSGILGDLRAAHQDITPIHVATPCHAQVEPRHIERMQYAQHIDRVKCTV